MAKPLDKSANRRALFKLALVMLAGLSVGVVMFVATTRSTSEAAKQQAAAGMSPSDLTGLIDQHEQLFDPAVLKGRYTLMYFGFTFCPDACPNALYNLTLTLQQLDAQAARIQPVFVSVDPARDSPAKLAEYLAHFSENIIGLTGTVDAIQDVERNFGVIAVEHRDEALPGGYTMDHSNEFLLFSPVGKLLMRLPADQSAEMLLEQLRGLTKAEIV